MGKKGDSSRPLYVISVVAEMFDLHPQTLRLYEREGLITPSRQNNQRKYSDEDIRKLEFIVDLTRKLGVNKAGLEIILDMRNRLEAMQGEIEAIMDYLQEDTKRYFKGRLEQILIGRHAIAAVSDGDRGDDG